MEAVLDDITSQNVDAIVNAAQPDLTGGGGVDGAIHRAAGPELLAECLRIPGHPRCPPGEARITGGYRLPARYVIHTVGPVWRGGGRGEAEILRRSYLNSLALAESRGLTSIAFPSLSTGAYGYPIRLAAPVAIETVLNHLRKGSGLRLVRFVLFHEPDLELYRRLLADLGA